MPSLCPCHQWGWVCSNAMVLFLPVVTMSLQKMSLYSSCNHYSTICSSIKRVTSPFCSCQQWMWICSTAIILFLRSVQDNLQKRQKARRFGPCHHSVLAISEGDSAVMPWLCSFQLWQGICKKCRYILLAIATEQFATMSSYSSCKHYTIICSNDALLRSLSTPVLMFLTERILRHIQRGCP